jgi:hypothetical protein
VSTDCDYYPYYVCSDDDTCEHKRVFPLYGKEFIGTIVLPMFLALCSMAGIGGSAVEIPLF